MYGFIYKYLELMCYIILCSTCIGYESGSDDDSLTPSASTTSVDSDKQ